MTQPTPNRLREIDPETASPSQRTVMDRVTRGRGRVPTPYKVWLHCPQIADGMETIGTYLNTQSTLSDAETEIVILSVAAFWQSPYVLQNHIRHSRTAGIPDHAIDKVCAGGEPQLDDPRQQLVAAFTWTALRREHLGDQQFAATETAFGRDGIAELLMLIGYYSSVAIAMKFHDVQPGNA